MRSVDTPVKKIRREVFTEICKVAFESTKENFNDEIEAIPYRIVQERAVYRDSIYRERAVASERVRLAMGMSLRPEDKAVHITAGMENSNIDESIMSLRLCRSFHRHVMPVNRINIRSAICAEAVWRIPVSRSVPREQFPQ